MQRFFVCSRNMDWTLILETWIRDPINERHSRSVIRNHMERMYMGADKDNWNKNIPQSLNIQIANVSNHLLKLAEDCGSYSHCRLEQILCACRLVQARHKDVRNVDVMDAFKAAKGIQTHVYHQHHKEFKNFTRAHTTHPALAPFGGGLRGVWQPMLNHEQLVVLLIMMPVTRRFEFKPTDAITAFRNMCSRADWRQWFNASCDMMVSEFEGNKDTDVIKRKVIVAKYTITANRACE